MSCLIFHGPGGRSSALADAHERAFLVRPPMGEDGLKVDAAREIADLFRMPPPGGKRGAFVLGPMDQAQPGAADALLKTIEDLNHDLFILNLWAFDLEEVMPTIQSRCVDVWCPEQTEHDPQPDESVYDAAHALVEAYRKGDPGMVLETLQEHAGKADVLRIVPEVLSVDLLAGRASMTDTRLWLVLREVLTADNLSKTEVAAALMPEVLS